MSRKELYEKVWTKPGTKLAKEYGFSDVWLSRICKENKIPRPPRGYWAQIKSGMRVPRQPLHGDKEAVVEIWISDRRARDNEVLYKETASSLRRLKAVVISGTLTDPHPLVQKSADILNSLQPDATGIVYASDRSCLNVRVSKDCIPRALSIMDSLIKTLTSMGFKVSVQGNVTEVNIDNVSLWIAMSEELCRRRLRARDHSLDGYYTFGYGLYERQSLPSGRLVLSIDNLGFYSECRRNWCDTDSNKLEDSLKAVIRGLIKLATLKKLNHTAGKGR